MRKNFKLVAVLLVGAMVSACNCGQKSAETALNTESEGGMPAEIIPVDGRKNFSADEAIITPAPAVMIATYDADGNPDVMMAAWAGQCGPKHIRFELSQHKTTDNIRLKKAFTISFASKANVKESDYFGIVSGFDVKDKVAAAGFTATKSPNVDAPVVNEYPLTLECRLLSITGKPGEGGTVTGEIVNMSAKEEILDANGKVDLDKLQPVIWDASANVYRVVGEKVGDAFSAGKTIGEK